MTETTPRFKLPLLVAGQAQKELTHNEALTLVDMCVQPVVVALAQDSVPASPSLGDCWIIGAAATGAWSGKTHQIAGWTSGGWRYCIPVAGMFVWSIADMMVARWNGTNWVVGQPNAKSYAVDGTIVVKAQRAAISGPSGGAVEDNEAQIAISSILTALREHGLIAS